MSKSNIIRRLASAGNQYAKKLLSVDQDPDQEELVEFATKVGAMKAKADILAAAGNLNGAANTHMERASEFYWREQHADAANAYRDAAMLYRRLAEEACGQLTAEQVKAWHARAGR